MENPQAPEKKWRFTERNTDGSFTLYRHKLPAYRHEMPTNDLIGLAGNSAITLDELPVFGAIVREAMENSLEEITRAMDEPHRFVR